MDTECLAAEFLSEDDYSEARKILEEVFQTPELKRIYHNCIETGSWKIKKLKADNTRFLFTKREILYMMER